MQGRFLLLCRIIADGDDLLAVFFCFGGADAGDGCELVGSGRTGVGDGAQSAVVQDEEGRHAELFCVAGAPEFEGLLELLGCGR
jgi:hypothetical protein